MRPATDASTARGTSALLAALLTDTLDPGYAAAAARRGAATGAPGPGTSRPGTSPPGTSRPGTSRPGTSRPGTSRPGSRVLLAVGAFLIGLLLVVAYLDAHRAAPADARTRADLRARVTAAQADADQLSKTVRSLQSEADVRRATVLGRASAQTSLTELQAGTTAVRGPGLRVSLDNPPRTSSTQPSNRPGTTPIRATFLLTDIDVREIVNELWAEGAEAIAVNTVRLTPTSAIRFAGQAVLVDFAPITAPYSIAAIGDPETLVTEFTGSAVADRFRTLSSADGFTFSTDQQESITLPASTIGDPHYARRAP